jgi:hypothetical protein
MHTDISYNVLLTALKILVQNLAQFLTSMKEFDKCSKAASNDPQYLEFRKKVFSEAHLYGQYIFPDTMDLLEIIMGTFSLVQEIDDVAEFINMIHRLDELCTKYLSHTNKLRRQHNRVIGRLMNIEREIKDRHATCENDLMEREQRKENLGTLRNLTGSMAAGLIIAGNLVPQPGLFQLVGLLSVGVSLCAGSESCVETRKVVELKIIMLNLEKLVQMLERGMQVVAEIAKVLGLVNRELLFISVGGAEFPARTFFRALKTRGGPVFAECEQLMTRRVEYEGTMESFRCFVEEEYKLEWLAHLEN